MTLVSANVGSVISNSSWKSWDADVVCLQETRVGKNNHRSASKLFQTAGFTPCFGDLLPGLWYGDKTTKTPCGGTLIAGGNAYIQPFDSQQDGTGLYLNLFKTKRIVAAWLQVTRHKKALLISFYGSTSASQDPKIHMENNHILEDVFAFVSQFGKIPVVIAGDLQAPPMSYPAIAMAASFQSWHDPVAFVNEEGELSRPLTFSNDGTFSGAGDSCTSIDAVLVNDIAFAALTNAEVLEVFGRQHRPIRLTFEWSSINQVGYHLFKTAPFVLNNVEGGPDCQLPSWELRGKAKFYDAPTVDEKWDVVNSFLQEAILAKGAVWGQGPRTRGQAPTFVSKTIAPKQLSTHCAANRKSAQLANLVGKLQELFVRISRQAGSAQDRFITTRTAVKAHNLLVLCQAPISWSQPSNPDLVDIHYALKWATAATKTFDLQLRAARIKRWKQRIKQSSQHGCAYIFHHLKSKQLDEPPNLVVDADQNILFNPNEALSFLNQEWDQIYSANALIHHPLKMLETVWPFISHEQVQAEVGPITGQDLHHIIQKRKPNAAPGLDGWRTQELQLFTPADLQPCADFFNLIEDSALPLPSSLVTAKQVILNKPGPSTPLNKRLITILPALLLAYTGARFAQLQEWQRKVMPQSILGGIKGRFMSDLYNQIRLDVDESTLDNAPLVGIKLDKAKAFDRVLPNFAAALFLAFGVPQGIVNFFVKIYAGLRRHLSYRNWMSPEATTACNGVCQGCSFSLLAMNVYTKVWCHLLEHLPEVSIRAYIDDSYLWRKLQKAADLQKAVQVTKLWDFLSGQKLNENKSSLWGTSCQARKTLKSLFPGYTVVLELDVLGTKVYTSNRHHFAFPETKLKKVLSDIENIAALPVSKSTRSFLIGAKIVPQISFGVHISKIPQQAVKALQNAIAKALWVGQPLWRSKQLLQCILSQPHRTDPKFAGAFRTVLEVVRLCFKSPDASAKLLRTWQDTRGNHAMALGLKHAFDTLGITCDNDLTISFLQSQPVSLFSMSPRCISAALKHITRQACYSATASKARKDFRTPDGLLDFQQTIKFLKLLDPAASDPSLRAQRLECVLVGCTLTNDRLASSGWVHTASCRFCGEAKESLPHLLECAKLQDIVGRPTIHEFGNNFAMLGHVQHPKFVGGKRLRFSDPGSLPLASDFSARHQQRLWTDGSVLYSDKFWITSAAFAVVDEQGHVRKSGSVFHWHLSAYTAELWAIIEACAGARFVTIIFSDCASVVQQARHIFQGGQPDDSWSCYFWWLYLARLVHLRRNICQAPFHICWIPAHCHDDLPIDLISEDMAALKGTTIEHISMNRIADREARQLAYDSAVVYPRTQQLVEKAVAEHQQWLIEVHRLLPTDQPDRNVFKSDAKQDDTPSQEQCQTRFPTWAWGESIQLYPWKPKIPVSVACPKQWTAPECDWISCCDFLRGLRWQVDIHNSVSFNELAVHFHIAGFGLQKDRDLTTFLDIYKAIREAMKLLNSVEAADPFPGVFDSVKPRCCGRVLPQGCVRGAAPHFPDATRVGLARLFALGAGRKLEQWSIPITTL